MYYKISSVELLNVPLLPVQGRERSTSEGCEGADKLTFLVEMFNKTEAALVADVFRACNGDHDAAMQSLMDMQARGSPVQQLC